MGSRDSKSECMNGPQLASSGVHPSTGSPDITPEAISELVSAGLEQVLADQSGSLKEHPPAGLEGLAELSHDLRSPLGATLLVVERLRRGAAGPLTPEMDRHLRLLHGAARTMMLLIEDAHDLAHLSASPARPTERRFSLEEIFSDIKDLVQPLAENGRLILRFSSSIRGEHWGNIAALRRAILNLVTNALRHTETGGVTITAEEDIDSHVRITIRDTGCGMPEQLIAWIESGFPERVAIGRLGLKLCANAVRAMNGSLRHEAPGGGGSCMTLTVPLRRATHTGEN